MNVVKCYSAFVLNCIAGQMYMLSYDGHIDSSDISVTLYPPGVYIGFDAYALYKKYTTEHCTEK